jgi:hypothetical protein
LTRKIGDELLTVRTKGPRGGDASTAHYSLFSSLVLEKENVKSEERKTLPWRGNSAPEALMLAESAKAL